MEVNEIPADQPLTDRSPRGLPLGRFVAVTQFLTYLSGREASIVFPTAAGPLAVPIGEGYLSILEGYINDWKEGGGLKDVNPE